MTRSRLRAAIARACRKNPTVADAAELYRACDIYRTVGWRLIGGSRQYGNVIDGLFQCINLAAFSVDSAGLVQKPYLDSACTGARRALEGIPAKALIHEIDLRVGQRYLA